ncbi:MAG: hypothetical protein WCJ02_14185 [bacterium]
MKTVISKCCLVNCYSKMGVFFSLLLIFSGCAVTPVAVRVSSLTPTIPTQEKRNEKVFLVVKDSRISVSSQSNVFGLKRNGYWIPMAVVFLAHSEKLDSIVARRISPLLEGAGYQVVGVIPNISNQSDPDPKAKEYKRARTSGVSKERATSVEEIKEAKKLKDDAEFVDAGIETIEATPIGSITDCSAVVEIRIRSFYTDIVPFSGLWWPIIQSWEIADVYVYAPGEGPRTVTWGKKFRSYNSTPWAPVDFGGEVSYNTSVNICFRQVARKMEKMFRDPAFQEAIIKAGEIQKKDHQ